MANIQFASVGSNVLRDNAYQLNNATSAYERITLLEMADTNLVLQSDALATTWSAGGSPVVTNAVGTYAGRPFSRLAYTTGWGTDKINQQIVFTGDGVKAVSLLAKMDGSNTGTFLFSIFDATATANRLLVTLTVAAGGGISAAATTGTLLKTVALADGVYRFDCQTTTVTAANVNRFYLGPNAATCPSILLSGAQASDNLVPSSLIPTTTATVTRAADVASRDLAGTSLSIPRESTWYVKFLALGTSLIPSASVFQIGDATTASTNTLAIYANSSKKFAAKWYAASTATTEIAAVASPALNDQVELLIYLDPTGKLHLTQALNGTAAATVDGSDTEAFQAAFASTKVYLNSADATPTNAGMTGVQSFKAIPGNYTLAQMRAL